MSTIAGPATAPAVKAAAAKKASVKPSKPVSRRAFRGDIEGLRAVAVVVVIVDHLFGWPSGGFIGVDIFFVISGFLITGLLLKEHAKTGRISFVDFYKRRIRRILPASMLVLAGTVGATYFVFNAGRFNAVVQDAIWATLFSANWHLGIVGTDYMDASGPISPLRHYWSLSVEEQYYFIWPVIIVAILGLQLRRRGEERVAPNGVFRLRLLRGVLAGLVVISFVFALWDTAVRPTWAYFSTASRAWELGAGALLALSAPYLAKLSPQVRSFMSTAGVLTIGAGLFIVTPQSTFPAPWALLPVLAAMLVIAAGTGLPTTSTWRSNLVLDNPISTYLGKISYSLYLWHFPAIILIAPFFRQHGLTFAGAVLGATLLIAVLSFHLVEDPIRRSRWLDPHAAKAKKTQRSSNGRRRPRVRQGKNWPGLIALLVLGTVTGVLVNKAMHTVVVASTATAGAAGDSTAQSAALVDEITDAAAATEWPELNPTVAQLGKSVKAPEWVTDGCLTGDVGAEADAQANATRCVYGDPKAAKTAVLLGDSIAISYLPGIRAALPSGWKIQVLTMQQCPVATISVRQADGSPHPGCDPFRSWTFDQVATMKPDLVIAASAENSVNREVSGAAGDVAVTEWEAGLESSLAAIVPSAKQVVLLSAPPVGNNLQECRTAVSKPADCNYAPTEVRSKIAQVDKRAAEKLGATVRYVDTKSWFCTKDEVCPSFVAGIPVFADGAHLTAAYSTHLAPALKAVLDPQLASDPSGAAAGTSAVSGSGLSDQITAALSATSWPELTPGVESLAAEKDSEEHLAGCSRTDVSNPQACSFGNPAGPTIVVVGDSMAEFFLPTVRAALGEEYHIRGLTMAGCPSLGIDMSFPSDDKKSSCVEFRQQVIAEINATKPAYVLVTNNYGAAGLMQDTTSLKAAWASAAAGFVAAVEVAPTQVIFVAPPPPSGNLQECQSNVGVPWDCVTPVSNPWTAGHAAELEASSETGAQYLETQLWYCSEYGYCPSFVGTTPVKIDGLHATKEFSQLIAPVFKESITPMLKTAG